MESLYEISSTLEKINRELITAEGEITPALEMLLDETNLALEEKAEGVGKWVLNLKAKEGALDAEIKRLQARKTVLKNARDRFDKYVIEAMTRADKKKFEFVNFDVTVSNNPASVEIVDEMQIPAQFTTIIPETFKVDKTKIKTAIKAGVEVPGARLITDRKSLRVK